MKKCIIITLLLAAASFAFAEGKAQTVCPVMGHKVNEKLYANVKGYRIYVCCKSCIAKVKATPEKYIEKMKAAGVTPEKNVEK